MGWIEVTATIDGYMKKWEFEDMLDPATAEYIFENTFRSYYTNALPSHYITDHYICQSTHTIVSTPHHINIINTTYNGIPMSYGQSCCQLAVIRAPIRIDNQFNLYKDSVYVLIKGVWKTYKEYKNTI